MIALKVKTRGNALCLCSVLHWKLVSQYARKIVHEVTCTLCWLVATAIATICHNCCEFRHLSFTSPGLTKLLRRGCPGPDN